MVEHIKARDSSGRISSLRDTYTIITRRSATAEESSRLRERGERDYDTRARDMENEQIATECEKSGD